MHPSEEFELVGSLDWPGQFFLSFPVPPACAHDSRLCLDLSSLGDNWVSQQLHIPESFTCTAHRVDVLAHHHISTAPRRRALRMSTGPMLRLLRPWLLLKGVLQISAIRWGIVMWGGPGRPLIPSNQLSTHCQRCQGCIMLTCIMHHLN